MRAKVTYYPNHEVRAVLHSERLPKSLMELCAAETSESMPSEKNPQDSSPVKRLYSPSEPCDRTFNIKSKVDTEPRSRRLSLSRYGRRQLLRAGSCFDKDAETETLLLTGTLPGSTYQAFRAIAEFSTYATKTLSNWLTRHEPKCKWMYAWEFQGRGALHLHLVCQVSKRVASFVKDYFKDEWNRILQAIQLRASVDMYQKTRNYSHSPSKTQVDVTVCDREPSRYISKYISKNATNAKGFARFPPSQWFQVSRSLLRSLREKTQTFICEGLAYGQALAFIEEAQHNLSSHSCSGYRRFPGSILAWSGYGYSDSFQIEEWGKNFMNTSTNLSPISLIAKHAITALKSYPQLRCWAKPKGLDDLCNRVLEQLATETETLFLIESVMTLIMVQWDYLNTKTTAARFLQRSASWLEAKYGCQKLTETFRSEIDKICEESLTG